MVKCSAHLATHDAKQLQQAAAKFLFYSAYFLAIALIKYTIVKINEPKAKEPKWNLIGYHKLFQKGDFNGT